MNWRRGMWRVWIVGSAVWAAVMLALVFLNPPRSPDVKGGHSFQAGDLAWAITMIAFPPVAVLIGWLLIAGAVHYIIRGFRNP